MKKKLLFLIPAFVGMSVFAQTQQRVGVKTTNPQATLDINGNMAIEKVDKAGGNENTEQLVWNNSTRQVQIVRDPGNLFYILDYRIEAYEVDDWKSEKRQFIRNFDSGIPSDKFTVIFSSVYAIDRDHVEDIVDLRHVEKGDDDIDFGISGDLNPIEGYYGEDRHVYKGSDKDANYVNSVLRKSLWVEKSKTITDPYNTAKKLNTWHLSVGYPGARPDNGNAATKDHKITFEWHVRLIAMPKKSVNVIEPEAVSVTGDDNPSGAYTDSPLN